jgi:hypothetical protein
VNAGIVEFYPGTDKQITPRARRKPEPEQAAPEDIFAKPRKGYQVNGAPFECYAIGVLAKALGRQVVTIRLWERDGLLPRSPFSSGKVQGAGKARLYTREQIEGIVRIAEEEGVLNGKSIRETAFTKRVERLFTDILTQYRSKR